MLFSGIPFLFYFLPAVLILYFSVPRKGRNAVLLLASLLFYAWGEPKYVALMVVSILLFYGYGLAVERSPRPKIWLVAAVCTGAAMLGLFKYADFAVENFNALMGLSLPLLPGAAYRYQLLYLPVYQLCGGCVPGRYEGPKEYHPLRHLCGHVPPTHRRAHRPVCGCGG